MWQLCQWFVIENFQLEMVKDLVNFDQCHSKSSRWLSFIRRLTLRPKWPLTKGRLTAMGKLLTLHVQENWKTKPGSRNTDLGGWGSDSGASKSQFISFVVSVELALLTMTVSNFVITIYPFTVRCGLNLWSEKRSHWQTCFESVASWCQCLWLVTFNCQWRHFFALGPKQARWLKRNC